MVVVVVESMKQLDYLLKLLKICSNVIHSFPALGYASFIIAFLNYVLIKLMLLFLFV